MPYFAGYIPITQHHCLPSRLYTLLTILVVATHAVSETQLYRHYYHHHILTVRS